ncbi:uncharacterized protein LOC128300382 [Anopheles moucheti]|uniref:uncharacterized protein LOC128300382 n=1 Tax=Anopheles moucheti TaxID=186751 RepID=UPI0022EFF3E2|nr:uncharacterized protein LOC128300382 [Anopheles moucheti]
MKAIIALCLIAGVSARYAYNNQYEIGIPQNYYASQQYNGYYSNGQYNNAQYNNGQYNREQYNREQHSNVQTGPTEAIPDSRCPRTDDLKHPVHLPYAGDCSKFLKCTGGMGFAMSCPGGLEFSARTNRCDYPAVAQCSVEPSE